MHRFVLPSLVVVSMSIAGAAQARDHRDSGPAHLQHVQSTATLRTNHYGPTAKLRASQPTVFHGQVRTGPRRGNPGVQINSQPVPPGKGGWDVSRSQTK